MGGKSELHRAIVVGNAHPLDLVDPGRISAPPMAGTDPPSCMAGEPQRRVLVTKVTGGETRQSLREERLNRVRSESGNGPFLDRRKAGTSSGQPPEVVSNDGPR